MQQPKTKDFVIGRKTFARYSDEYSESQINFIPFYILEEDGVTFIGTKNDMVGTEKGYFKVVELTGKYQINTKYLSNIYLKKKD
jgi:hypothetical protein